MNETRFNFAYVFSIVILLVFAYITFLGLSYWSGGSLVTPILLTVLLLILVAGSVMIMSISRSTRWTDMGLVGQICFGVIVLATLLAASVPFTNFMRVVKEQKDLKELMIETANSGAAMDKEYQIYAENRINNYRRHLNMVAAAKKSNPMAYKEIFAQAAGANDTQKIDALVESLKSKLIPVDANEVVAERHSWLNKAADLNVWNPMTASNINSMKNQMQIWTDNYRQLSSTIYKGETAQVFEYDKYESRLNVLVDSYQKFRRPSGVAVLCAFVCFIFMLLPYFLAQKSLAASRSSNSGSIFE